LVLNGSSTSNPRPSSPTPPPSVSQPVVTVRPSPTLSVPVPAATSGRQVDSTRPPPPPAPALLFPAAPLPDWPLLLSNEDQLFVQYQGKKVLVGPYGSQYPDALNTRYGVLVRTVAGYALVSGQQVTILPGTTDLVACGSPVASPDGRFVAWGRAVGGPVHQSTGIDAPAGELGLYDLQEHRAIDRVRLPQSGCPLAFLKDGRVALSVGDGGGGSWGLWNPVTGEVTTVRSTTRLQLQLPSGHSFEVLFGGDDGCLRLPVQPESTPCLDSVLASPDGTRLLDQVVIDTRTGKADTRLLDLLTGKGLGLEQSVWLDDTHVLLVATHGRPVDDTQDRWTWNQLLSCAMPVAGKVSCTETQQEGPVFTAGIGADAGVPVGPLVALVHRG
jgi:hypothetical protein